MEITAYFDTKECKKRYLKHKLHFSISDSFMEFFNGKIESSKAAEKLNGDQFWRSGQPWKVRNEPWKNALTTILSQCHALCYIKFRLEQVNWLKYMHILWEHFICKMCGCHYHHFDLVSVRHFSFPLFSTNSHLPEDETPFQPFILVNGTLHLTSDLQCTCRSEVS